MIHRVESALFLLAIVLAVAFFAGASRRLGLAPPLVLVVVGVAASFIPGVPEVELEPELILVGILPPLLYAAAIRTSLVDFAKVRVALVLLAVGLVIVTAVVVGYLTWWVLPGVSLAAAIALGAVVAPPDAVAATAVARRVGMPRRIVTILEGESLFNDATALVALTAASAAITSSVTPAEVGLDFLIAVAGGLVIGLVAAAVLARIRRHITDPVLDTTLSFTAPFLAFLPAEAIHASGVLAVVVTGLLLGHKAPVIQSANSRISEAINWRTVQFLLENAVFLLIGLQLRPILSELSESELSAGRIAVVCAVVLVGTILVRIAYVLLSVLVYHHGTARMRRRAWSWAEGTVVSWAGMRGVVTLAAVFVLPTETPEREVLQLAAFVVVAGTLLLQGTTLPKLVRVLRLPAPSATEDALATADLITRASRAGLARLEEVRSPDDPPEVLTQLTDRAKLRADGIWERLGRSQDEIEPPAAVYRRLRLEMLEAERAEIIRARDAGTVDNEVLRAAMEAVDLEESLLDPVEDLGPGEEMEVRVAAVHAGDCEHLHAAPSDIEANTPGECEDCLREGTTWVHLRLCLTCGHVGCCDSSVGRHATRHFHETDHAVMRSHEPGEAWRWCYVDELLG